MRRGKYRARPASTRCAAVRATRRAPPGGQNPRRLGLKAMSLSWPLSPQPNLRKACARMPHSGNAANSSFTSCGRSAPAAASAWAMKAAACCCTRPGHHRQREAGPRPRLCRRRCGATAAAAVWAQAAKAPSRASPGALLWLRRKAVDHLRQLAAAYPSGNQPARGRRGLTILRACGCAHELHRRVWRGLMPVVPGWKPFHQTRGVDPMTAQRTCPTQHAVGPPSP